MDCRNQSQGAHVIEHYVATSEDVDEAGGTYSGSEYEV